MSGHQCDGNPPAEVCPSIKPCFMCRFIGVLDFLIHEKHHFKSWHHRSQLQRSVFLCLFQMCVCTVSTHFVYFSIHPMLSIWTKAIIRNMIIT